jgi:hypothetical protein
MPVSGGIGLLELSVTPGNPNPGTIYFYTKIDGNAYILNSSGIESAIGSTNAVTSLTGDVTGTGPGATAATVAYVGGQAASVVAASVVEVGSATSSNVVNTLVKRDGSGNFSAGIVTATLNGNASTATTAGSAINFTGALAGDVTGYQSTTVVSYVGGKTASDVASATATVDAATSINTPGTLVLRDGSGNFTAGTITASLVGNVTGNVSGSAASFTGSLSGDVSGTQSATVVQKIQGTAVNSVSPMDAQILVYNSTSNMWNPVSVSGDVSLNDSGVTTISSTTVTGKLLTGYAVGANTPISATDSILGAFEKVQGQLNAASSSAITALTGDVVATGPGSVSATIQPNVVTNTKLAQVPADTLKGNNTGSTANVADLTVSQVNTMLGTVTTVGTYDSQAPVANALDIVGNDIYAQSASATVPGMVNTTTQTFAGTKTFSTIVATTLQSASANPAASGVIRLANADVIAWRNSGNSADLSLQPHADGILEYANVDLVNLSATQTLTNKTIAAGSNTITGLTNSNLSGSAGITGANIASSTVSNTNLAQMAANTVKANTSNVPANPVDTALGTTTESTSSVLVLTGWTDATIGSPTIQVLQATTSESGYLSSTDWNTFNNKQPAGNYITALTGDVTASGPGSSAATVTALQGHSVSNATPTDAQLLLWASGTSKWTPESMSGDATIADTGALTLATVNSNTGSFGSSTAINTITVNAKGLITAVTTNAVIAPAGTLTGTTLASNVVNSSLTSVGTITSGVWNGSALTAAYMLPLANNEIYVGNSSNQPAAVPMSGDATIVASGALTLATVNSNVGSFGLSTAIPSFTVNAKGLITAASTNVVIAPAGTLTGTTLASGVINSSIENLGTQNATLNMGNNAITNADTIEIGTTGASTGGLIVANGTNFSAANATGVDYSGGSARFISWGPTTSTYSPIEFLQVTSNSSSSRVPIYASAAGQIGIGNNTNPSYALDVSGTFASDSHAIFTDGSGDMTLNSMTVNTNIGGTKWEIFGSNGHVSFDNAAITSNGSGILTVADLVVTASSTTAITANTTAFVVDSTNNVIGIGIQPSTSVMIDGVNTSGASKLVQMTGYGVGSTTGYRGRFARGTSTSPTAIQSGDIMNALSGRGYGTSQFATASTGAINVVANETFTNTSNQTYLQFLATPTGSVTSVEHMRVAATGVTLGAQSASTDLHTVNGGWIRTTKTITATYTIDTTTTDDVILCNQTGAINIQLPTPTVGRTIVIKDRSGNAQNWPITLLQFSTESIEGLSTSKVLYTNYGSWTLHVGSAGNWWFI